MFKFSRLLVLVLPVCFAAFVVACTATPGKSSSGADGGAVGIGTDGGGVTRRDGGPGSSGDSASLCPVASPERCSGICTNTKDDAANCGACGARCDTSERCNNGACVGIAPTCPATTPTSCSGTCVDLQTDNANCGSCGSECATSAACSGGSCHPMACPTSAPTRCGGSCTNTQSDVANCGGCGNTCNTGQACSAGTCSGGGTLTCQECGNARCSSQIAACNASAECVAVANCIDPCTTQACADACAAAHPSGVTPYNNFSSCMQTNCHTECNGGA